MPPHLEQSLQQDIDLVRSKVMKMGGLVETALKACVQAIAERNRQLAYGVVLRDRYIDELENELDRLCQRFLLRQQPVAGHLRFIYGVIKINNELERVGDYAKSIARQFLAVSSIEPQPPYQQIVEIANLAISLLRSALHAFAEQDAELARATRAKEKGKPVDNLRYGIHHSLLQMHSAGRLPSGALPPLFTIANRFERVGDQAGNICEEVVYMCTGAEIKHSEEEVLRILFVDEHNACRGQMAEGIGNALGLKNVQFRSAGIAPQPVDLRTVQFMADRGIDISRQTSRYLNEILDLENYQVIITLGKGVEAGLTPATSTVNIAWETEDPSRVEGTEEEVRAVYEQTFHYLKSHIQDLVRAFLDDHPDRKEEN